MGFHGLRQQRHFQATFVYRGKESAEAAREAILPVLADAVYIATEES
jgi:hypothetical protein